MKEDYIDRHQDKRIELIRKEKETSAEIKLVNDHIDMYLK